MSDNDTESAATLARRAERFQLAEPSSSKRVRLDVPLSVLVEEARAAAEEEEEAGVWEGHHRVPLERRVDSALVATRTEEEDAYSGRRAHYKRPTHFPLAHAHRTVEERVDSALMVGREGGEPVRARPRFHNQTWTAPQRRFPNLKWEAKE